MEKLRIVAYPVVILCLAYLSQAKRSAGFDLWTIIAELVLYIVALSLFQRLGKALQFLSLPTDLLYYAYLLFLYAWQLPDGKYPSDIRDMSSSELIQWWRDVLDSDFWEKLKDAQPPSMDEMLRLAPYYNRPLTESTCTSLFARMQPPHVIREEVRKLLGSG